MRAAILDKPGKVRIHNRAHEGLGPEDVGIKVAYAGVCGSDIHMYGGTNKMVKLPQHPGHEFAGIVIARGKDVQIGLGQLVAVEPTIGCMKCEHCEDDRRNNCEEFKVIGCATKYGGFAEYIPVPEYTVLPVDIGVKLAPLIEPASIGVHASRIGGINKDYRGRVFVQGAGTIGLMAMAAVKYLTNGNVKVIASDVIPARAEFAKKLRFADHIFMPQHKNSEEFPGQALIDQLGTLYDDGFDIVIDAACEDDTLETAIHLAKKQTGVVVDLNITDTPRHMIHNVVREVKVRGSRVCNKDDFEVAYKMMKETTLSNLLHEDLGETKAVHIFNSLDNLAEAYEAAKAREFLKCLVKINP